MTAHRSQTRTDAPSAAVDRPRETPTETRRVDEKRGATPDLPFEDLMDLLGDEYACELLRALADGEKPARELATECEMSRATVYRRLDRLTDAGVVESRVRPEADGHHRHEFRLVLEEVAFSIREDGVDSTVRVRRPGTD